MQLPGPRVTSSASVDSSTADKVDDCDKGGDDDGDVDDEEDELMGASAGEQVYLGARHTRT